MRIFTTKFWTTPIKNTSPERNEEIAENLNLSFFAGAILAWFIWSIIHGIMSNDFMTFGLDFFVAGIAGWVCVVLFSMFFGRMGGILYLIMTLILICSFANFSVDEMHKRKAMEKSREEMEILYGHTSHNSYDSYHPN